MLAIIDYGAGNIGSVTKAFSYIGCENIVTSDPKVLLAADAAVMPGVGAFGDAMASLREKGLEGAVKGFIASGKPFLGICLGMQILFSGSEESPGVEGLSVLKGDIKKIPYEEGLKIPHMGWNSLEIAKGGGIFKDIKEDSFAYFVHSYYLNAKEDIVTSTVDYGVKIHASVQKGNVYACQFHPEKSGDVGLAMLKNFKSIYEEGSRCMQKG